MHFCLKVSGGTETAYLNGEVIAFADNGGYSFAPSSTGDIRIGSNFSNAYNYSGYLSDFHYVSGSAVSPDGNFIEKNDDGLWVPKEYTGGHGDEGFHLPFDEAQAATAFADSSSNAHSLTPSSSGTTHARAQKKVGDSSLYFDGSGYLEVHDGTDYCVTDMGTGDFTLECWVYSESLPASYDFLCGSQNSSGSLGTTTIGLTIDDTDGVAFNGYDAYSGLSYHVYNMSGDGFTYHENIAASISADTWTHFAVVRNGSTLYMYKNGAMLDSTTCGTDASFTTGNTLGSNAGKFTLGRAGGNGGYATVYLDEFRISTTARYSGTSTTEWDNGFDYSGTPTAFNNDSDTLLLIHSDWGGGLGADSSGNNNNFTTSNLGSEDQVIDTPAAGKNFCTLNPLGGATKGEHGTLSEGNLRNTHSSQSVGHGMGTIGVTSGKWYFEATNRDTTWTYFGVTPDYFHDPVPVPSVFSSDCKFLYSHGNVVFRYEMNPDEEVWGDDETTVSTGDVIGVAFDADDGKIWYSVNGAWSGSSGAFDSSDPDSTISGYSAGAKTWFPCIAAWTSSADANFGQDATFSGYKSPSTTYADSGGTGEFFYEPPSGFKALCTENLAAVTLNNAKSSEQAFEAVTYIGNGNSSDDQDVAVSFAPDLVWVKNRDASKHHVLVDTVRGEDSDSPAAHKVLHSNKDDAEVSGYGQVIEPSSTGFTAWNNSSGMSASSHNQHGDRLVAWAWKAGTGFSSTNGGDTTSGSKNADAGFSIVTWSGDGWDSDNDTPEGETKSIYHGLGVAPELIIAKSLSNNAYDYVDGEYGATYDSAWVVWTKDLSANTHLELDSGSAAISTASGSYPDPIQSVGATTFGASNAFGQDEFGGETSYFLNFGDDITNYFYSSDSYVAYCFRSVEGYSKVGSYTGNGSSDGAFVYCGFRPALIISKNESNTTGYHWRMWDSSRSNRNVAEQVLYPSGDYVEGVSDGDIDILSNGFKHRESNANLSGNNYVFYAVAENPFKHANAR